MKLNKILVTFTLSLILLVAAVAIIKDIEEAMTEVFTKIEEELSYEGL